MRNISLLISYDGTNYHGWQCQPDVATVQETIAGKIEKVVNHSVKLYAAGRTDSGVHAMGQVVNFHSESSIALKGLVRGINSMIPDDIRVLNAIDVKTDFHARYSAKSKTYLYRILNSRNNSPFYCRYSWYYPFRLNIEKMNDALKTIVGAHDFSSFKKKHESYKNHMREVLRAEVCKKGDFVDICLEATGFLRYMVRNIVGTIVLVGTGKLPVEGFVSVLKSGNREMAGPTAPPQGLFLQKIDYGDELFPRGAYED